MMSLIEGNVFDPRKETLKSPVQAVLQSPDYISSPENNPNSQVEDVTVLPNGWVFFSHTDRGTVHVLKPTGELKVLDEVSLIKTVYTPRYLITGALEACYRNGVWKYEKNRIRDLVVNDAYRPGWGSYLVFDDFIRRSLPPQPGLSSGEINNLSNDILTQIGATKIGENGLSTSAEYLHKLVGKAGTSNVIKAPSEISLLEGNSAEITVAGRKSRLRFLDGSLDSNWFDNAQLFSSGSGLVAKSDNQKNTRFFESPENGGRQIFMVEDPRPSLDMSDQDTVYFVKDGQVKSIKLSNVQQGNFAETTVNLPLTAEASQVVVDPKGNFLLVKQADNTLTIYDKRNGQQHQTFDQVKNTSNFGIDQQGNVFFVDTNDVMRVITTNLARIDQDSLAEHQNSQFSDFSQQLVDEYLPLVQDAESEGELRAIQKTIQDAKQNTPSALLSAYDQIEAAINKKMPDLLTRGFLGRVGDVYAASQQESNKPEHWINLFEQMAQLKEERKNIDLLSIEVGVRNQMDMEMKDAEARIKLNISEHRKEIVNHIMEKILPRYEEAIQAARDVEELNQLNEDNVKDQFHTLLNLLGDNFQLKQKILFAWGGILRDKRAEIEAAQQSEMQETVNGARIELDHYSEGGAPDDPAEREVWLDRVNYLINQLPEDLQVEYQEKFSL